MSPHLGGPAIATPARRIVAPLAAAALALTALTVSAPAVDAATGCRPTTNVLSLTPTTFPLPGGADMRVWDTGHLANSLLETRIVAVRIPAGTLTPKVLTAPKVDSVRTPQQLATPVGNAVVVVNGGVFDPVKLGIPVESQITGGLIRKATRAVDSSLAILGPDSHLDFVNSHLSGMVKVGSTAWAVAGVNWQSLQSTGITVYTSAWGATRHAGGPVAVVLAGGKVVAKRTGSATTLPPRSGQMVLTAPKGTYATALSRLKVGTTVTVALKVLGSTVWDKYPHTQVASPSGMLMAGGSIVRYGVNVITTCSGSGEDVRPRTVIGFMPNGDLLVVAMSGRALVGGVRWGGATNHQAADYMVRLGVKTAVKLDGGTSTTMLVRRTVGGPLIRMDRTAKDFQRPTPDSLVFLAPTA